MSNLYQRMQQSRSYDPVLIRGKNKNSLTSSSDHTSIGLKASKSGRKESVQGSDSHDSQVPEIPLLAKKSEGMASDTDEIQSYNVYLPKNTVSIKQENNMETRSNPSGRRGAIKREVIWTPNSVDGDKLSVHAPVTDTKTSSTIQPIRGLKGRLDFVTLSDDPKAGKVSFKISYNKQTNEGISTDNEQPLKPNRQNKSRVSLLSEYSNGDLDYDSDSSPYSELPIPRSLNLAEAYSLDVMTCASEDDAASFRDDKTSCDDEAFRGELWVNMANARRSVASRIGVKSVDQTKSMKYRNLINDKSSVPRREIENDEASYNYDTEIRIPVRNKFGNRRLMISPRLTTSRDLPLDTKDMYEKVDEKVNQIRKEIVEDIVRLDHGLSQLKSSTS
jgi:hypothetical protein